MDRFAWTPRSIARFSEDRAHRLSGMGLKTIEREHERNAIDQNAPPKDLIPGRGKSSQNHARG